MSSCCRFAVWSWKAISLFARSSSTCVSDCCLMMSRSRWYWATLASASAFAFSACWAAWASAIVASRFAFAFPIRASRLTSSVRLTPRAFR